MFAALVVAGRAEAAGRLWLGTDALEKTIEGQVEIKASLFAIGNNIETRSGLIVNGSNDGVVLEFFDVVGAEVAQVRGGELKPRGKRITADDGSAERAGHSSVCSFQCEGGGADDTRWISEFGFNDGHLTAEKRLSAVVHVGAEEVEEHIGGVYDLAT